MHGAALLGESSPQWSLVCFLPQVTVPGFRRYTPRHPPRGCFRYCYDRLSSSAPTVPRTSALFRPELGAALVWGKEGILPPASGSSSFLRSPPSHTPLSRFY